MRSGVVRSARACAITAVVAALVATAAGAATQNRDTTIARAGVLLASDFPAGFRSAPPPPTTHSDQIAMAKGVEGCGPYVTIQRRLVSTPGADSAQFDDGARTFGNETAVFPSEKIASSFLALDQKPSMVGCLENYLEKQFRQSGGSKVDEVNVHLERQDIAGLGDDSVVYEGGMDIVLTDGSTVRTGIGNAMVRVGRALDTVLYFSQGPSVTDVLTPAIDASVTRLRTALARSS